MITNNPHTSPFCDVVSRYYNIQTLGASKSQQISGAYRNTLKQLSSLSEVVLQSELDVFRKNGGSNYERFVDEVALTMNNNYPFLEEKLLKIIKNNLQFSENINNRLKKDFESIISFLNLDLKTNPNINIEFDFNLGDSHNGEGVGLLHFPNGSKIVYKPRSSGISNAYNYFISWVNDKLDVDLKTFKVLDRGDYSWLEFVDHKMVNSQNDLSEYYYKAGIISACALLLGSKDCHQENVIASGRNPVVIDHETIIQPYFSNSHEHLWENLHKIPPFSVLESSLIMNRDTNVPLNCVGFGINNSIEFTDLEAQIVRANTIESKRVSRFVKRKLVEKNVPTNERGYVFVDQHKEDFINGFVRAYDMFLLCKTELLSNDSPFELFKDKTVRYVWRPTYVYFKILRYLRNPTYMSNSETYESKLRELLSKAYNNRNMESYSFILDHEVKQMLNGDIPIFQLNSQDNFLEGNEEVEIFKYNCIENMIQRVNLLSLDHKSEQLSYIKKWALI